MSVGSLGAAHDAASVVRRADQQRNAPQLTIGERLDLRVLRNLGDRRYLVTYRDMQRIVESTVTLHEGSKVRAVVGAVGERLELRYLDAEDASSSSQDAGGSDGADALEQLETRFAVNLPEAAREVLQVAMDTVSDRGTMAGSGMYLAKLSLPVESEALQALYAAQVDDAGASTDPATAAVPANADPRSKAAVNHIATLMGNALESAAGNAAALVAQHVPLETLTSGSGGARDRNSGDRRELARRLLNVQDDGSVAYRQGVLPVLIAGQLVELDLVYFGERREADRPPGLRKLVMTLRTSTLGRVEVQAQAVGDRLAIAVSTDSAASSEALAAHADEVRDLIARLGWNVESVVYDFSSRVDNAARHIVNHVLNAGTLSRLA